MTLDLGTLLVAAVTLDLGAALYFWLLWLGRREQRIHLWIACSTTSAMAGCVLYTLRTLAPDWVAVWGAQLCFIQLFAFLWAAVRLVQGRPRPAWALWAGAALWTAACLVPPFFAAEGPRNVLGTLCFTAYCTAMSVEMLRGGWSRPTPHRLLVAVLLLLLSASSVGLVVYTAVWPAPVVPLRGAHTAGALWLLLYLVVYMVLILAIATLELGNEADRHREAASTDGLTGLPNRRAFLERAHRLAARCEDLALLVLDLDHFKRINDTWGHPAGDAALVRFAALLRVAGAAPQPAGAGGGPLLARMGGEEFVCLIPEGGRAAAARLGEAIRRLVEADRPEGAPPLTVSIGYAAAPARQRTVDELLQAADKALYRAKMAGRNRVEGHEPGGDAAPPPAPRPAAWLLPPAGLT